MRGLDSTCLLPLNTIASRIDPIEQYENNVNQLLDYMATYPNAVVGFHASDMILRTNTDVSYITEPQACSGAAGYFFLGNIPSKYAQGDLKGLVHVNCNI